MDAAEKFRDEVVDRYSSFVNPSLARLMAFAGFGVETRAEGCYLFDENDRPYLDFLGGYGVFSLGHRNPRVVEAVQAQLHIAPLSGKVFFSPKQAELAARLAEVAPGDLEFTFFSNSGAEAVEAALKFARVATGRTEFISTVGGYHGKTLGALSVTGREKYRKPFEPLVPGASFVEYGSAQAIAEKITERTAAVIVEPIQGEGGIIVPPAGYLSQVREICDRAGALLIVDEVQTGLGRTGKLFACEHDGVKPDIMTLAKCLGGGVMPIGATMGTQAVWEKVYGENPLLHTSTFGGNPMACAAGIAALDEIQANGLVERSRVLGEKLVSELRAACEGSELVKEVRGKGLMVGLEFARDEVGELCIAQMTMRGLVAAYTLNNPRVIRFEPPLVVTEEQIMEACGIVREALTETEAILKELVG